MTSLPALLRAAVDRNPEQPAFIRGDQVTTYAELERCSTAVAANLQRLGIRKGDRVALVIDGDADFLIAYYGIAKAGAVVVPLSPDTRSGPLVYALSHAEASAVILDAGNVKYLAGQLERLPQLRFVFHRGDAALGEPAHFALMPFADLLSRADAHAEHARADDLLSITFTSGTTGRPKGVMLAHRNLVANVRSIVDYLELNAEDRVAMVLPFYYVYGNSVLHTHVCAGATIIPVGPMTFPAEVLKGIAAHRCTGFSGVPSMFARLAQLRGIEAHDLGSLRYLTQAGAAMTPALTQRLREVFPRARVFVMYGQTEAAARLAYVPPAELERKLGSAGKAIPGVTLKIVDAEGKELPRGDVGEIAAQGDNIMLGYWKDPEATARALRPEGLRTGDLARMDEEGFVYIVGRESEMIKSGAHRISPREIEEVIDHVVGVRECAVVGVPDELMGQAIAAFVVPAAGHELDRQSIMRTCLSELPRFKLPKHVLEIGELPRTPAGKLRRLELVEEFARRTSKS